VLNPWNIDALEELEAESGQKVNTILQLRVHPSLIALREKLLAENSSSIHDIELTYITSRGRWYLTSWKGQIERSGGLATNIGVHFYDLLIWLFGSVQHSEVHVATEEKTGGFIQLERARVRWFLSIDSNDLPSEALKNGLPTYRSITIDGEEIEFSGGFTDLHTEVYKRTLEGKGFGLADCRPSIQVVHDIRVATPIGKNENSHPFIK
jgi:UDP-N-acetyl-2-amino-2-deoxyglucuronate dehydrogenase